MVIVDSISEEDSGNISNDNSNNQSALVSSNDDNNVDNNLDDLGIDALQIEVSQLLRNLTIRAVNESSTNLFLRSKLDLPLREIKGAHFSTIGDVFDVIDRTKVPTFHS